MLHAAWFSGIKLEVKSKILLVVMVRLILKIYAQQSNICWWRKHIHPEPRVIVRANKTGLVWCVEKSNPPGFHLRFMLPSMSGLYTSERKKSPKRAPEWIAKCQAQIWVAKDVSCTFEQAPPFKWPRRLSWTCDIWSWLDFHLWNQVQKNGVFVSVIDGQEMRFRVWNISVDGDLMA